jgi:hypothetical protein
VPPQASAETLLTGRFTWHLNLFMTSICIAEGYYSQLSHVVLSQLPNRQLEFVQMLPNHQIYDVSSTGTLSLPIFQMEVMISQLPLILQWGCPQASRQAVDNTPSLMLYEEDQRL